MFDWMSISTNNPLTQEAIYKFSNENNLTIEKKVSQFGELLESGRETTVYKGIRIILLNNGISKLMFSAHKLFNNLHSVLNYKDEPMNHDTFDMNKMSFIMEWLKSNFKLNHNETYIHQLEFGFNLSNLNIETSFILNNLISFKGKRFSSMNMIGRGNGLEVSYSKFYKLKFYDKALQNNLPFPIFRIEYKALKMQSIKNIFAINPTISALLNADIWRQCKLHLLNHLNLCVIGDKINLDNRNVIQILRIASWFNPIFWQNCTHYKRSKQKKEFDNFLLANGIFQLKHTIKFGIKYEFSKML